MTAGKDFITTTLLQLDSTGMTAGEGFITALLQLDSTGCFTDESIRQAAEKLFVTQGLKCLDEWRGSNPDLMTRRALAAEEIYFQLRRIDAALFSAPTGQWMGQPIVPGTLAHYLLSNQFSDRVMEQLVNRAREICLEAPDVALVIDKSDSRARKWFAAEKLAELCNKCTRNSPIQQRVEYWLGPLERGLRYHLEAQEKVQETAMTVGQAIDEVKERALMYFQDHHLAGELDGNELTELTSSLESLVQRLKKETWEIEQRLVEAQEEKELASGLKKQQQKQLKLEETQTVAKNLRYLRGLANISIEKLARALDISVDAVNSHLSRVKPKTPKPRVLRKYASWFSKRCGKQVTVQDLRKRQ